MCSIINSLKIRINKKIKSAEKNVAMMDKKRIACASFSSLGNMIASSYFQLATEVITATMAAYSEKNPNSSGVYNRVKKGVAANSIPWEMAVPEMSVMMLRIKGFFIKPLIIRIAIILQIYVITGYYIDCT
jgi:hypothetical protein